MNQILDREEVTLEGAWWLDLAFRGGVEKRVGWWVAKTYWFVVCFRDGTRGPRTYGTNNDPYRPPRKG